MWTVIGDAIEAVGGIDLERLFRHAAETTSALKTDGSGSSETVLTSPARHTNRVNVDLDLHDLRVDWEPFRRSMRRNVRLSQHALNDAALYGIFEFACRLDQEEQVQLQVLQEKQRSGSRRGSRASLVLSSADWRRNATSGKSRTAIARTKPAAEKSFVTVTEIVKSPPRRSTHNIRCCASVALHIKKERQLWRLAPNRQSAGRETTPRTRTRPFNPPRTGRG